MITKRVTRRSGDHFGRLARYLAATGDKGEKPDSLWLAGCDAGPDGDAINPGDDLEDLELAIAEIEATQARYSIRWSAVNFLTDKAGDGGGEGIRTPERNFFL